MITQRFRPILWAGGAAIAATGLYLVSLQVASEHKRLEAVNRQIGSTEHDIRLLKTEFSTRASLRQLEKWNGESLALTTPRAIQYLPNGAALDHFDVAKLNGKVNTPMAAMAEVTSDAQSIAAHRAQEAAKLALARPTPPTKIVMLDDALAQATGAKTRP